MTLATSSAGERFVTALAERDFARARGHLHAGIDFRAMTPNRVWEAGDPGGVEDVLRSWLDDPEREIESIEVLATVAVEDTLRVGWRARGTDAEGPFIFEQLAYVRERDGQVTWLRVMCSGPRRPGA